MWSNGRSEAALLAAFPVLIEIRSIRGARRMRLRYDEVRGLLKLTCPPRTSRRSALAWALKERLIAGAALDVYEKEPEVNPALLPLENVLLIPHLASATTETRTAMADLAVSNAIAVLNGQPPITPVP